eukprot:TRINITY_DN66622_c6_g5_i1.p1 TRINITY_DN66622_c6_g5~~TRINITY_DN66622_c6_g5_i1.p1  ORF type:complete len:628 (-),score=74.66 TRINITY_DN66622_c6_g5_i1:551-2308(-)
MPKLQDMDDDNDDEGEVITQLGSSTYGNNTTSSYTVYKTAPQPPTLANLPIHTSSVCSSHSQPTEIMMPKMPALGGDDDEPGFGAVSSSTFVGGGNSNGPAMKKKKKSPWLDPNDDDEEELQRIPTLTTENSGDEEDQGVVLLDEGDEDMDDDDDDDIDCTWEWKGKSWIAYDPATCRTIEKAYQSGKSKVKLPLNSSYSNPHVYQVDFTSMLQKNTSVPPYKSRPVRRIAGLGFAPPPQKGAKQTGKESLLYKQNESWTKPTNKKNRNSKHLPTHNTTTTTTTTTTTSSSSSSSSSAQLTKMPTMGMGGHTIPDEWTDKELQTISKSDKEWTRVEKLLNSTITYHGSALGCVSGTKTEPTRFELTKLVRIQNKKLWRQYCNCKTEMLEDNDGGVQSCPSTKLLTGKRKIITPMIDADINEFELFHGTKEKCIELITTAGFDDRVSSVTGMFGGGLYFAEHSSKANQYIQCPGCGRNSYGLDYQAAPTYCNCKPKYTGDYTMILSRVLLGNIHVVTKYNEKTYKGTQTHPVRRPPLLPGSSNETYDSVLGESVKFGGVLNCREMVVYDRRQAYPYYIIYFKRRAK